MLAGIPVRDDDVLALVELLEHAGDLDTAATLRVAAEQERRMVALTVPDREAILSVLDDPPVGLAELRGVLLGEHEWRQREGL
jgi:hypothetical protein